MNPVHLTPTLSIPRALSILTVGLSFGVQHLGVWAGYGRVLSRGSSLLTRQCPCGQLLGAARTFFPHLNFRGAEGRTLEAFMWSAVEANQARHRELWVRTHDGVL